MSLALAALVVVLGQSGKVEVIKGKKSAPASKQKVINAPEYEPQAITDKSQPKAADDARAAELDKKAAQLDAKEKALDEKAAQLDENEKAKAEKQKQQQKQLEKLGAQNQKLWQQSNDALAGGTNE
jgi:hypothetical protein